MRNARSGVRRIESIETSALNCRIGGEVPADAHQGSFKGFDRFSRFALIAGWGFDAPNRSVSRHRDSNRANICS